MLTARGAPLALLVVFLAIGGTVLAWVRTDQRPPAWDYANHLERMVACGDDLAAGRLRAILERSSFYPPLVPCAASLVYRLMPSDAAAAQVTILLFLGLGMVATYLLGRRFFDPTASLVAAVMFATAPFVVFSTLNFQLDLPLAAVAALFLYVLLRTEEFRSIPWSVAAGVVGGVGLLTKPPFAVFALPPALVLAWPALRRRRPGPLLAAAAVALALSLPWYGLRALGLPAQLLNRSFRQAAEQGSPPVGTLAGFLAYPRSFASQLGALAVVLFLGGLYRAARRHPVLLVACLVPFGALLAIQNKNPRYTLPLLPVASLIAAETVAALEARAGQALAALVLVTGGLQVAATTFGAGPLAGRAPFGIELAHPDPPAPAVWPQRALLAQITADSRGQPVTVGVIPNAAEFSVSNFRYYAARDGLPLRFGRAWSDYPLNVEYVVLKTGDQGPAFASDKARRVTEQFAADPLLTAAFPTIGSYPLPDGSVATLRVRRPAPVTQIAAAALARRIQAGAAALLAEWVVDGRELRVGLDWDPAGLARGWIKRVTVTAASARVGELRRAGAPTLRLEDVRLVLEGLAVNPGRAAAAGRLEPLALDRFRIERLTLTQGDLQAFLAAGRRTRRLRVRFSPGQAEVHVGAPGPAVDARVRLEAGRDGRPVVLDVHAVRIGGVPVPDLLAGWIGRAWDPTLRWAALPVAVDVAPVRIERGRLEVTAR
jgi:Dolichyl-phosphate-mannose-protein mannosyltransferase/LmeA-like phospholipid-binding